MKRSLKKRLRLVFALLAVAATLAPAHASNTVAGLDFCADQFVLAFAPANRIKAISEDAVGPHSFYRDRAMGLPAIKGNAEEILMLQPDLLIRSWRGNLAMDALFARVGVKAYHPPYASDYEATLRNFQAVAQLMGEGPKGRAFVARYRERYRALEQAPGFGVKAVYLTPSGYTAGRGSAVDAIIRLAGLSPIADEIGVVGWAALPLEKLVMSPPDLVIGSFFEEGDVHVSNWSSGRHGVFRGMVRDLPAIMVPGSLMSCGGAFTVDAAEYIRVQALRLGLIPPEDGPMTAQIGGGQ